jgi:pyridoxine kinase
MPPTPAVLAISSQVSAGPVGGSAIIPALLSLGVVPIAVPTIVLSNHPGHGRPEGLTVPAPAMKAMLERLLALGLLAECRTVLTGYFANAEQAEIAADFLVKLRDSMPSIYVLCDPVLGDDNELYVGKEIAETIRDRLVPLAHGLTPNAFEAGWLSGTAIHNLADAEAAARAWPEMDVIITSIPDGPERLATALFSRGLSQVVSRPLLSHAPHGTGDLFGGLIAGYVAKGTAIETCLAAAVEQVERAIAAGQGSDVLDLAQGLKA